MSDPDFRIWVFFYGTFMEAGVLAEHGVHPVEVVAAKLSGFELSVRPRANLERSDRASAYGALALVTHDELDRLYAELEQRFELLYLPEAVIAEALDGTLRPALCYLAPRLEPEPADPGYVNQLAACVRELGAPAWYVRHVESFAPDAGDT